MKKFLFVLILVIMLPFMLCSCSYQKENNKGISLSNRFVVVESTSNAFSEYNIIVDIKTKVMYYQYKTYTSYKGYSGITVLYNADGTPMIYEGEL